MGGAVIMLALLAKQQRDRQRRMESARKKREEELRLKKEKEKQRRSYSSTNYGENRSYADCVRYEIEEDEELKKFFDDLEETVEKVRNAHVKSYTERAIELDGVLKKYESQMQEMKKKLEEEGVEVETGRSSSYNLSRIGCEGNDVYTDYAVPKSFNGLRLSKDMVENPNDETYKRKFEDLDKQTAEKEAEKAELEKELRRLERLKRIPFTDKYELDNKIKKIKEKISDNASFFERKEEAKRNLDTFNSLTPEQRKDIASYLEATGLLYEGTRAIRDCAYHFDREKPDKGSPEIMEEALAEMDGKGYTEEELNKIFLKLDRIAIRRYRGEYRSRSSIWSPKYKGTLEGFIKHVYDTDEMFVERNADLIREGIDD